MYQAAPLRLIHVSRTSGMRARALSFPPLSRQAAPPPPADAARTAGMRAHALTVMRTLGAAISKAEDMDALVPLLRALAERHVSYGVAENDFDAMGVALLWMLEDALGTGWDKSTHEAWVAFWCLLATLLKHVHRGIPGHMPGCEKQ